MKKILMVGNPNTGKSTLFSRLTGTNVIASNYPGTTVEFTKGTIKLPWGEKAELIDVPGIYDLEPTTKAEQAAVDMIEEADIIINVIDSSNLERNLNLTVQLLKKIKIPMIVALNMFDIAVQNGVTINEDKLSGLIKVPVVATSALSGEGVKTLVEEMKNSKPGNLSYEKDEKWKVIGDLIDSVQRTEHRHPTLGERIAGITIHHITGPFFALFVMILSFSMVRIIGEGIIKFITEPFFFHIWLPIIKKISVLLIPGTFIHDILIGELISGKIDFEQSFGLLSTGFFIPLSAVLPYIVAFYAVLSILEDIGYLPRLGVLVDNIMHRLGLHGLAIIPMFLGLGCNVPGAMATRVLETRKERFIASTLMAIAVPCMAQIAMIMGLLGPYGISGILPIFGILFIVWIFVGLILKKSIKGETPEIIVDIPPYHFPYWKASIKKIWMRLKGFVSEAIPFVLLGVFIVNILYVAGVIEFFGRVLSPIIINVFGLPMEAVGALLVGFLRKDVAIGMLAPLGLTLRQLIVASVVLTVYFPCVATFIVLLKEMGIKDMIKAAVIMLITAFLVGGISNWVMLLIGMD